MRHRLVPAVGAVNVVLRVARACRVCRRAGRGVLSSHGDDVLIDVVAVHVVEVSIVQEVLVSVVLDLLVTAAGAVGMIVIGVCLVVRHGVLLGGAFN